MTDNQPIQGLLTLARAVNRMLEPLQPFIQTMARVSEAITPFLEAVAPYIEHFVRYNKFIDAVRPTGWLPYHTVSIDYVEECGGDISLLESHVANFYQTNWNDICQRDRFGGGCNGNGSAALEGAWLGPCCVSDLASTSPSPSIPFCKSIATIPRICCEIGSGFVGLVQQSIWVRQIDPDGKAIIVTEAWVMVSVPLVFTVLLQ